MIWEQGDSAVEEGGSFKVWGRVGGDVLLSWVWDFMGVVYVEGIRTGWEVLAKILNFLLGWGIK